MALPCLSENSCSQQAQLTQLSQNLRQQRDPQTTDKQPPPTHVLHRWVACILHCFLQFLTTVKHITVSFTALCFTEVIFL